MKKGLYKNMIKRFLCFFAVIAILLSFTSCGGDASKSSQGNILDISDPEPGDIYAEIKFLNYDEKVIFKLFPGIAPEGVEEFTTRAERGFYDNRNIHRIVPDFIIQGGSINFDGSDGNIQPGELFPIETSPYARNFYGAISLVADANMLNYCQFYIVTNKNPVDINAEIQKVEDLLRGNQGTLTEEARTRHQKNLNVMQAIPENVRQLYLTRGGAPHLDDNTTVFGQLVSGGEVLDAIANVHVAAGNLVDDYAGIMSKPTEEIIIESITIIRFAPLEDDADITTTRRGGGNRPPDPDDDISIDIDLNDPVLPSDDDEDEDGEEPEEFQEPDDDGNQSE
ncbi:MAG: peptidylprolyl isomerase [Oscillospiraceae bacterium]|nr:peptidylprolyl isomerase [Oscillospiraceae bacterium]